MSWPRSRWGRSPAPPADRDRPEQPTRRRPRARRPRPRHRRRPRHRGADAAPAVAAAKPSEPAAAAPAAPSAPAGAASDSPVAGYLADPQAMTRAAGLFRAVCTGYCHSTQQAANREAPNLFDCSWTHGSSDQEVFDTIAAGVPDTQMQGFGERLPHEDLWKLVAYHASEVDLQVGAPEMLAGVYRGRGQVRAEKVAMPEPGAGEVRLRVEACGLCGSDLHIFHSEPDRVRAGMTLGHELVGVIDAVGEGVAGWRIGDRATVEPLLSCGRCEQCAAGFDNRCREYATDRAAPSGRFRRASGGAGAPALRRARRARPSRVAALAEPVAVCVHGLRLGRFDAREPLLVLGAGSIGILTVAVARLWGATDIAITARHAAPGARGARAGRHRDSRSSVDPCRAAEYHDVPAGGRDRRRPCRHAARRRGGGRRRAAASWCWACSRTGAARSLAASLQRGDAHVVPVLHQARWRARTSTRRCVCSPLTPTYSRASSPTRCRSRRSIARSRSPTTSRAAR